MDAICLQGDFRQSFLKHVSCLKLVTIDYNHCGYLYKETVYHMEQGSHHQPTSSDICCAYNEFANCSRTTSRQLCDSEGAEFVNSFIRLSGDLPLQGNCSVYTADSEQCLSGGLQRAAPGQPGLAVGLLLLVAGRRVLARG